MKYEFDIPDEISAEMETLAINNGFASFSDMFNAYCIHELQSARLKPIQESAQSAAKTSLAELTGKFPAVRIIAKTQPTIIGKG